jgi:CBS domain-containing membrane protein/CBS domain-containing protein
MSTNGHLHPYQFHYLSGDFERARLEPTLIHGEKKLTPTKKLEGEIFAIDIMCKDILKVGLETGLLDIKKMMSANHIRHVPVLKGAFFQGIISDRDLLKLDSSSTFQFLKAEEIMNTLVVVATEDTPLAHIARVLLEEKISSIPIINKAFHLTGMITRSDLLRAIVYNQLILK